MSAIIEPELFDHLIRKAIVREGDPKHKKKPEMEIALLHFLFEADRAGASVSGIIEELINRVPIDEEKAESYRKLSSEAKRRKIRRLIDNIRDKLEDYFVDSADPQIPHRFDIIPFRLNGELRYRLDIRDWKAGISGLVDVATESHNTELIHNEISMLLRERPLSIDFLGIAFVIGFESTDFKKMLLENIDRSRDARYRFLLPKPDSELARTIERIHTSNEPLARNIIRRIEYCEEEYSVLKSQLDEKDKNRIIVKYYEYNPLWRIRFLIKRGIGLHCKVFYPEKRQQLMVIFTRDSFMYPLAVEAFEAVWSREDSVEVQV